MLKIASAQLNLTVGDIEGNVLKMTQAAHTAFAQNADVVVFPELSLTGYYPGDLLDEPEFLHRIDRALRELEVCSVGTPGMAWVVGTPLRRSGPGKRLNNGLVVVLDGYVVLTYCKQLLPTYNIFDERRHFEPGPDVVRVLRIKGHQVGFLICEDGWNADGQDYVVNPFARLADAAPDVVVSINASPSNIGKREQRHTLFAQAATRFDLPILCVNQIGGHDQLVYDGASFAVTPSQGVCFEAQRFTEDVTTLAFDPVSRQFLTAEGEALSPVAAEGLPPMEFYRRQIVLGLRDYARRCGFQKVVVGSSGGIDSALTLALAVEALGADNVVGITMPSSFSSSGSVSDSEALCQNLGIALYNHPIREIVGAYQSGFEHAVGTPVQGLTLENLQARVRGTILMEYSNANGHLLLATGNKSEISVGYCTLYGDTNGGLGLIGDLYKTEIFELCRHLNASAGREIIPASIIDKEPSAELAPGQHDTDSLPPYEVLDGILKMLVEGNRLSAGEYAQSAAQMELLMQAEAGRALVQRIRVMIARNEYKRRQAPPILRVRARAFGSGRQMPIAAKVLA